MKNGHVLLHSGRRAHQRKIVREGCFFVIVSAILGQKVAHNGASAAANLVAADREEDL